MACVQQVRTSKDTQVFPSQVESELQSISVIKSLLAIGVSGIMYLRGIFPEKAYGSKYVDDQRVMILREERSCPGACQIVEWIVGCFDAIQMKYLQTVIMSVSSDPDDPQNVTEFYQFRIQYNTEGAQMDFESTQNKNFVTSFGSTKKASSLLVRKLYTLMQNLGPLPNKIFLNMTLTYYDAVTPHDYQPPGFKEADGDMLVFEREPVRLTMGEVVTPFHSLKLDMATERHRLEPVEENPGRRNRWLLKVKRDGSLSERSVIEDVDDTPKTDNTDNNAQEIELRCYEKMDTCEVTTMEAVVLKRTSDMEAAVMTTRSGRIIQHYTQQTKGTINARKQAAIKKNTVCQYEIPNSQETPRKKRKFSESKDNL
ncbi:HORMA domain-containing protein 1 isoform X1 [Phyllopteryx taeniolatus]|uniref:HORMA domain-containing protein 1 isoform X1 n=2 Tax=Phyllopteryx taeniolatus TaxID=161469 RepID=UPI002AD266F2|nr:HORMA domain-containing protein 1 isoform X1 [Phyllopteryx taeniolatus]XP_061632638.1 HORMA domain-containing protein 1 isoform X1 [Phyllopteryx taeniolatus]